MGREVVHSRQRGQLERGKQSVCLGKHGYSDVTSIPSVRSDMAGDKSGKVYISDQQTFCKEIDSKYFWLCWPLYIIYKKRTNFPKVFLMKFKN